MITLLLINIIAFTTWKGFKDPLFAQRVQFNSYAVKTRGEVDRVLTSALIHSSWAEFIFLAITLFIFGMQLPGLTLFLVFSWGIIGGNLLSAWLYRDNLFFTSFGMAAGVNSVLFAFALLYSQHTVIGLPIPLPLPAWVWAFLSLALLTFGFRNSYEPARRISNLTGSAVGLVGAGALHYSIAWAHRGLFLSLLATTLLCIWLAWIHRTGLPWKSLLAARFSFTSSRPAARAPKPSAPPIHPAEVDAILDKISESGIHSLTPQEREKLQSYSRKNRP